MTTRPDPGAMGGGLGYRTNLETMFDSTQGLFNLAPSADNNEAVGHVKRKKKKKMCRPLMRYDIKKSGNSALKPPRAAPRSVRRAAVTG